MWAGRELLDHQLIDRNEKPCGKIDDLVFRVEGERPPTLDAILTGYTALAHRLNPRSDREAHAIPWSRVTGVTNEVRLDLDGTDLPTERGERWLARHVLARIAGSGIKRRDTDAAAE